MRKLRYDGILESGELVDDHFRSSERNGGLSLPRLEAETYVAVSQWGSDISMMLLFRGFS